MITRFSEYQVEQEETDELDRTEADAELEAARAEMEAAYLAELEAEWNELTTQAEAEEEAVLAGELDKADYIKRDLERQARRKELEREAGY